MAVPYFFQPVHIKIDDKSDTDVYVDGAMGINFPLYLFVDELPKTIGFKITDIYTKRDSELYHPNHKVSNIANYSAALMLHNLFQLERLYLNLKGNFWDYVIGVPFDNSNALKFDISPDEKLQVMQKSFDEAIRQIQNENRVGKFESLRLPPPIQGQLQQMSAKARDVQLSPIESLNP
jgi:predicted acylesterase/phospholipase RssA